MSRSTIVHFVTKLSKLSRNKITKNVKYKEIFLTILTVFNIN